MIDKEYISAYVPKEFAEKFRKIDSDEQKHIAFDEYLKTVQEKSKNEFKANLESLDEDTAIYTGLMLKVKQAFEKAKDEQLNPSYATWESFDKEIPSIKQKTSEIVSLLKPITEELEKIRYLLGCINTYSFDQISNSIATFQSLANGNRDLFEIMCTYFNMKKVK